MSLSFTLKVGASGFTSVGWGRFSAGAAFDAPLGEFRAPPGNWEWLNPIKDGGASVVTGMGTGARIQIYGRAGIELKLRLL